MQKTLYTSLGRKSLRRALRYIKKAGEDFLRPGSLWVHCRRHTTFTASYLRALRCLLHTDEI